ncbi:MAG: carbohydrate ABC transporter substrate-binding protein [Spirochaetales bacterium]|nr:carbohydrate ABC transporter substrate-binding protein [Spirochaetales bacterium]
MKRVSTLLFFVLALALSVNANSNKEASAKDVVEVNIFQFKVEIAAELDAAARLYESTHPGVKIVIETVGGGDDYGAALRAKNASGNMADIYNIGGPQDVKDWMTMLEDLSDQPWVSSAMDGILSGVTVDNKIYGLPFNMEGYGFAYNKRIFKDAGIDASKIVDFKSLEAAAAALDQKIKSGALADKYPLLEAVFEYAAKETWVTGLHTSNLALSPELGNVIAAADAKTIDFKYADGLKKLLDLQAKYSSSADKPSLLNAVDYSTQVDTGLAIERVAIIQQGNWIYGGVSAVDKEVADNLGFLPMPIVGAKEDSIAVGVPMHWSINSKAEAADKAAAKDFLNWLYTSEAGKDIVVNKFFFIPPLKGYDAYPVKDALGQSIMAFAAQGKTVPWVFMGYPTDWGMSTLGVKIQAYYAGELTWDKVVAESKTEWELSRK